VKIVGDPWRERKEMVTHHMFEFEVWCGEEEMDVDYWLRAG